MYKSLRIQNFRCHEDLALDDLARVNLIAGKNNVGKTALLEALFVWCGAYNPALALTSDARRGLDRLDADSEPPWSSLFTNYETSRTIGVNATEADGVSRGITLRNIADTERLSELSRPLPTGDAGSTGDLSTQPSVVRAGLELVYPKMGRDHHAYLFLRDDGLRPLPEAPPPPPFNAHILCARKPAPLEEDADHLSKLQIVHGEEVVLTGLRVLEPELDGLSLQRIAGQTVIHGSVPGRRQMPLALMGEGMQRLLTLLLRIARSPKGIVLIDEVENGFHHSVLRDVLAVVGQAAKQADVQVFATTHSFECITAAHAALGSEPALLRLYRIDRAATRTTAVAYDPSTIAAAAEMGLEVR